MYTLPYLSPNLTQNNVISRGTVHWKWNPLHSKNFVIFDLLSFSTFCHCWPFVTFDVLWFDILCLDLLSFDFLSFYVLFRYRPESGMVRKAYLIIPLSGHFIPCVPAPLMTFSNFLFSLCTTGECSLRWTDSPTSPPPGATPPSSHRSHMYYVRTLLLPPLQGPLPLLATGLTCTTDSPTSPPPGATPPSSLRSHMYYGLSYFPPSRGHSPF